MGSPDTKRTQFLERAAAEMALPVFLVDWREWRRVLQESDCFLKIDPPQWESCKLEELDMLTGDYIKLLEELGNLDKSKNDVFLNHPEAIAALLDKRACKNRLCVAGLPVTRELGGMEAGANGKLSFARLLDLMEKERILQVFIKPVTGSGAAGVSAFRWNPVRGQMALYTCAYLHPEFGTVNTKRLRRYEAQEEIRPLLNRILALGCIVERWYAKAEYQGFSYDLRAVVQDGHLDFILARLSKGPITNLHLNNHPLEAEALGLPNAVKDSVWELCRKSMDCYPGLRSAGIDILLEKRSLEPRIIEMNAQGDLIYQDIYHENRIYRHQAEMMKRWLCGRV